MNQRKANITPLLLANIPNTNCHLFQVKINCSKLIKDGLQQRCHMTLLVSLFIKEKLTVWCISAKRNYYDLKKNNHKFQASVTERCTSVSNILPKCFKSTCEKIKS